MAIGSVLKTAAGVYAAVCIGGYGLQLWAADCPMGTYPAAIGPTAKVITQYDRLRGEKGPGIVVHAVSALTYPVRFVELVGSGNMSLKDFALAKQCKASEFRKLSLR